MSVRIARWWACAIGGIVVAALLLQAVLQAYILGGWTAVVVGLVLLSAVPAAVYGVLKD